jgi:AraC-like DNA-binding protein
MAEIFLYGCLFSSLFTAYVLFFHTSVYQRDASIILGILMLVYAYGVTSYLLISSSWILNAPFLYKTAAPFNLLFAPLSYLYVRSVIQTDRKFSKKDLLHFIPFLIFTLNYLPFYLMPISEKVILLKKLIGNFSVNYKSQDGILPESLFYITRLIQAYIYIYFQFKLINGVSKSMALNIPHVSSVIKWLKFFTLSYFITISSVFYIFIMVATKLGSPQYLNINILFYLISLSCFSFSVYLLLNPHVLYGIPIINKNPILATNINSDEKEFHEDLRSLYSTEIAKIEHAFTIDKVYLTANLNINSLAVILDMPARTLSFLINKHYSLRFTDFLNKFRIAYILNKMEEGYLNQYTIETLYTEAGFVNKSTFNIAFKKIVNDTPSNFLLSLHQPTNL